MQPTTTRTIVISGLIAAAYAVITIGLSPISFGPIQFRVASMLVPIVLLDRRYILGVCVGIALGNWLSPFGWYDWLLMPIAMFGIYHAGYMLRQNTLIALTVMAAGTALAVAVFPLHFGAMLPIWPIVVWIFLSTLIAYTVGWYIIWKNISPGYGLSLP